MRILIFSQWCYPEPGPRVHELAYSLSRKGHKVTIMTGFPTAPYTHFYDGYVPKLWQLDKYRDVDVVRLPHFHHGGKSPARRILHYVSFMLSSIVIGNLLIKKNDCMYVFLPPPTTAISAWIIGLFHRTPFVYDIQDIWPESVAASGMVKNRAVIQILAHIERFVYRWATAISVPSPGYKKNLIGKGVPPDKITIISNWADESIYKQLPYNNPMAEKLGINGKFNILFAGNLGLVQALDSVILAAEKLINTPDIQFLFAGSGIDEERLKKLSREKRLHNVRFLGRLSPEDASELCSIADVLLVHLKKDPLFEITIPSKTISYLACGKPILMAVEGDCANLIKSAGAGIVCSPENSLELANTIKTLRNMSEREREIMGKSGRDYFLDNFTRDIIVEKFEKLLKNISVKKTKW